MLNVNDIVKQMTLEEKCSFLSGSDFWHTQPIERLGVPAIMVADGPHGLRKQDLSADHLGINDSIKATCFPTASALASSWDEKLIYDVGAAIAKECQAEDVGVLLGPGANIKRSPVCGRNFEYFSEDPYLSSNMAKAHINGVQSEGVGTSLKHFLANNQEYMRMRADSIIDERTLNEIYLSSFETAVKEAKPWTIMCSYNSLNGEFLAQNKDMLTGVLREKWGYDGLVMTDWGAIKSRDLCAAAGLDLEMPGCADRFNDEALDGVKSGRISESDLDKCVVNILNLVNKVLENQKAGATVSLEENDKIARKTAADCMVLLKNEDKILPLKKDEKIALIGEFAEKPRFQGGGSSHINTYTTHSLKDEITAYTDNVTYCKGYEIEKDSTDYELLSEAIEVASKADKVILMIGLPDSYESEGYDREHISIPVNQALLVDSLSKINPNLVVVLSNGSPIEMPWLGCAKAVLEAYLCGQASGGAIADILYGKVNPSGKLAETFPVKLEDNPSYLNFPCHDYKVNYAEGIFVGYRYYEKKKIKTLFPFGFGLSYTEFEYSDIKLSELKKDENDNIEMTVSVTVKNTGDAAGSEIVQLYVEHNSKEIIFPIKQLKGFTKVYLDSNESREVTFKLDKRSFAYYNTEYHDWLVESGEYTIHACASSDDIRLSEKITIDANVVPKLKADRFTTIREVLSDPIGKVQLDKFFEVALKTMTETMGAEAINKKMIENMMYEMPMASIPIFFPQLMNDEKINEIVNAVNG